MATYEVYYHPVRKFSTIKRGFIWPAFWFGWLWLIYRRCWLSATVMFFVSLIVPFLCTTILWEVFWGNGFAPPATGSAGSRPSMGWLLSVYALFQLCTFLPLGLWGGGIGAKKLIDRGFSLVGKYSCKTGDAALALLHKEKKNK